MPDTNHPIDTWFHGLTAAAQGTLSVNDIQALRALYDTRKPAPRPRNATKLGPTMQAVLDAMEPNKDYTTARLATITRKSAKQITTTLGRLADKGEITKVMRGHWMKEV